jgi:hypothetical protein
MKSAACMGTTVSGEENVSRPVRPSRRWNACRLLAIPAAIGLLACSDTWADDDPPAANAAEPAAAAAAAPELKPDKPAEFDITKVLPIASLVVATSTPAATPTPAPQASATPAAAPSTQVIVTTQPQSGTTERTVQTSAIKDGTTTITTEKSVTPVQTAKEPGAKALTKATATYRGTFDFSKGVLTISVDAASVDSIKFRLLKKGTKTPVAWTATSPASDPKADPKPPVVVTLKPATDEGEVDVTVIVPGLSAAASIDYAVDVEQQKVVRDISLKNTSTTDWNFAPEGFVLTLKTSDNIDYRGDFGKLRKLSKNATQSITEELSTEVNSHTMFVDIKGLLDDKGAAKQGNLVDLPRLIQLQNLIAEGKTSMALPATRYEVRGVPSCIVRPVESLTLASPLPLEADCPQGPGCTLTWTANPAIGVESRLLAIESGPTAQNPAAPFLPLSFDRKSGKVVYVKADSWSIRVCDLTNCGNRSLDLFDSRSGYVAVPVTLMSDAGKRDFRDVLMTAVSEEKTADAKSWAVLIGKLYANLGNTLEFADADAEILTRLEPIYCLVPEIKKKVQEAGNLKDYLKGLAGEMGDSGDAADSYLRNSQAVAERQTELQQLQLERRQLISDPDKFGRELFKLDLKIEALQRDIAKVSRNLQQSAADAIRGKPNQEDVTASAVDAPSSPAPVALPPSPAPAPTNQP